MQKKWNIRSQDAALLKELARSLNIHPAIAQLLINRNVTTPQEAASFLNVDLKFLHDPFLFKGMRTAVERIFRSRDQKERVLVFGDYDVDGITSSALLNSILTKLGLDVIHHIPHRMYDGYGLNHGIAEFAGQEGVKLLIAVDCGITAAAEVETIKAKGIDVIIIDHHEAPDHELPQAHAIINPKQVDCPYPFKHLASVGLVAKLIQALLGEIPEEFLDLVAIGTIADVVPLYGENRIFAKKGLPQISTSKNKGLYALLDTARIKDKVLSAYHIGFVLGPRINATGRMDSAHKALDLFLSNDWPEAYRLAKVLDGYNAERQKMQREVVEEAFQLIEQQVNFKDHKVIVLSKEGWHKGVLGIVASRITDKFYRPSIVISVKDGIGTASARSISGFHLHDALADCHHCLINFGGHAGAAGLTIKQDNIDPFRTLINQVAHKMLEPNKLIPTLSIDCALSISDLDIELVQTINTLEPYGEGNPAPVFCAEGLIVKSNAALLAKETIKFWVTDGSATYSAVGFGMAKFKDMISPGARVDMVYQASIDDYHKEPVVQLKIVDLRESLV